MLQQQKGVVVVVKMGSREVCQFVDSLVGLLGMTGRNELQSITIKSALFAPRLRSK